MHIKDNTVNRTYKYFRHIPRDKNRLKFSNSVTVRKSQLPSKTLGLRLHTAPVTRAPSQARMSRHETYRKHGRCCCVVEDSHALDVRSVNVDADNRAQARHVAARHPRHARHPLHRHCEPQLRLLRQHALDFLRALGAAARNTLLVHKAHLCYYVCRDLPG